MADAKYLPTIGLEIHANVKTETKMFCGCRNDLRERKPNTHVCPICLGHPGTLPVANGEAIRQVIRLGLALGGEIAPEARFDRKSYFYPDLPKGYQISQYDHPLVSGGSLEGVRLRRVHLEEDAGRLSHAPDGAALVDFNRAGVPLLELVTEPDVTDAAHAVRFARELRRILRYLGVSDADMEEGQMRVEVNISLREAGNEAWGTKVEIKNLNSFSAVEKGIAYEIKRQSALLARGEKVAQETRGWNEAKGATESQRSKEDAHDYRYLPEPDLPPLDLSVWGIERLHEELPELPAAKRARFASEFGLAPGETEALADEKPLADYFEAAASEFRERVPQAPFAPVVNYLLSDLRGLMNERGTALEDLKVSPEHFGHFASLIAEGKLSSRLAKNLLGEMAMSGEDPETLMQKSGVAVVSDEGALEALAKELVAANPKPAADYRAGKLSALQFFLGQGMAKTKGQADPAKLREAIIKALS